MPNDYFNNGSTVRDVWKVGILEWDSDHCIEEWFFEKKIDAVNLYTAIMHNHAGCDVVLKEVHIYTDPKFKFTVKVE